MVCNDGSSRSAQRAAAEPEGGAPKYPLTEKRMGGQGDREAKKMREFLCALPNDVKGSARAAWEGLERNGGRVDLEDLKRALVADFDVHALIGGRPAATKKDVAMRAVFCGNGEMDEFTAMEGLVGAPEEKREWKYRGSAKGGLQELVGEVCARLGTIENRNALFYGLAGMRGIFGDGGAGMDFYKKLSILLKIIQIVEMSGPEAKIDAVAAVAEIFRRKAALVDVAVILDGCIFAMEKGRESGTDGLAIHLENIRGVYGG